MPPLTFAKYVSLAALCGGLVGIAVASQSVEIVQQSRAFNPLAIEITAGDTLHFTNQDEFIHHIYVHSPSFTFDSDEQPPGQTIDVRFPTAGTFTVLCEIHPKMHLTVTVR